MATTDILQFDSTLQNLQPQASYAGSTIQLDGFLRGITDPLVMNKILHQASFIAAGIANFCVAEGVSVPDDGNMANLVTEIQTALANFIGGGGSGPVALCQILATGNTPRGAVAGQQGTPGVTAPTFCFVVANSTLWVCKTTGTASTAVWVNVSDSLDWPFNAGTTTGTANAQVVTLPAAVQDFGVGGRFTVTIGAGLSNTASVNITIGAQGSYAGGTYTVYVDGPSGPHVLTGTPSEIVAGNMATFSLDSSNRLHLTTTELGTAALMNASSNTGTVAAIVGSGSYTVGHLLVASDVYGSIADGGPLAGAGAPGYVTSANNGQTFGPGVYSTNTIPGAININLVQGLGAGAAWLFDDISGTQGNPNTVTVNLGSYTFTPWNSSVAVAGPVIFDVPGEERELWYDGTTMRMN